MLDHTWKSLDYWGGLKEGTVELPISDLVPAAVKTEAEQIIADIKSGALHPFTGPIKDQAGVEKNPGGRDSNQCGIGVDELLRRRHEGRDTEVIPAK